VLQPTCDESVRTLRVIRATRGVGSRHQKSGRAVRRWFDVLPGAAGCRLSCKLTAAKCHCSRHELVSLRQVVPQPVLCTTQL